MLWPGDWWTAGWGQHFKNWWLNIHAILYAKLCPMMSHNRGFFNTKVPVPFSNNLPLVSTLGQILGWIINGISYSLSYFKTLAPRLHIVSHTSTPGLNSAYPGPLFAHLDPFWHMTSIIGRTCRQPSFPRWESVPGVMFLTFLWPQSGRPTPRWAVISTISPLF